MKIYIFDLNDIYRSQAVIGYTISCGAYSIYGIFITENNCLYKETKNYGII